MSVKVVVGQGQAVKLLILNPNSSESMTDGLKPVIVSTGLSDSYEIHAYTAPASAPASINNDEGLELSYEVVKSQGKLSKGKLHGFSFVDSNNEETVYQGILLACFSVHPLVPFLQNAGGPVIGVFEASILTALSLTTKDQHWGIVTTAKFWEDHLTAGVNEYLGPNTRGFAGVESTGLNASDFHGGVEQDVMRLALLEATRRLLARGPNMKCIIMGCVGMAGLEEIIRDAAGDDGSDGGYRLHIIDGVRAGLLQLDQMVKHQRLLHRSQPPS